MIKTEQLNHWQIVTDRVMGGHSIAHIKKLPNHHIQFSGTNSLKDGGGFAMIKHQIPRIEITDHKFFKIQLKGDGKRYQFRIKHHHDDKHAFVNHFNTSGEPEELMISISSLYPTYKGKKLENILPPTQVEEIGFLIANKREENFMLEIQEIQII